MRRLGWSDASNARFKQRGEGFDAVHLLSRPNEKDSFRFGVSPTLLSDEDEETGDLESLARWT